MRRKEREVSDPAVIREIIKDCHCCRIGLWDGAEPYIVPMSFGFAEEAGKLVFYFHSAKEGRKNTLIARGGTAAFEMDTGYALAEAEKACGYTARYRCVMGTGRITRVEGAEEKRRALCLLMHHYTGKQAWEIPECALEETAVFRLEAETVSCKVY